MSIRNAGRRIMAAFATICVLFSCFGAVPSIADEINVLNETEDPKVTFSGFRMRYGNDGNIQGFIDVRLQGIDATGIDFTIDYDSEFLELSEYDSNTMIINDVFNKKYFEQNENVFPITQDINGNEQNSLNNLLCFVMNLQGSKKQLRLNLTPTDKKLYTYGLEENIEKEKYIGDVIAYDDKRNEQELKCIKATDSEDGLLLGSISFNIKKPVEVSQMDAKDLEEIIAPDYDHVNIIYVKDDKVEYFDDKTIPAVWDVSDVILEVEPTIKEKTISSYEIFGFGYEDVEEKEEEKDRKRAGTKADLIRYLNRHMNTIVAKHSSGEQYLETVEWGKEGLGFTFETEPLLPEDKNKKEVYYPKGGVTYTVKQKYQADIQEDMEKLWVKVKVKVTPVTVTGFEYDRRIWTLDNREIERDYTWDDLKMPDEITPVLNITDDMYVPPVDYPGRDWNPSPETGDSEKVTDKLRQEEPPVSQTYLYDYKRSLFEINTKRYGTFMAPWLTEPASWEVDAYRQILKDENRFPEPEDPDNPDDPENKIKIEAAVEDESGDLVITVTADGITADDEFNIYLPDGTVLNSKADSDIVSVDPGDDGSVIITVHPNSPKPENNPEKKRTEDELDSIQAQINLGGKDDDFGLSIVETPEGGAEGDTVESQVYPFEFDARTNYYLREYKTQDYIEKDYSGGRRGMFPVYVGQKLTDIATYIEFPDYSTIPVLYHGQTGMEDETAILYSAKVEDYNQEIVDSGWKIVDSGKYNGNDALPSIPGETVTLEGTLQNYMYTDFGWVENHTEPERIVKLKIKVTTQSLPEALKPTPTPDPGATPTPEPSESPEPTEPPGPDTTPTPNPDTGEAIKITTVVGANETSAGTEVLLNPVGNDVTFEYDKKNPGYTPEDVQKQLYTIENIGLKEIDGLTVRITNAKYPEVSDDNDDDDDEEEKPTVFDSPSSYVMSEPLSVYNEQNELEPLSIRILQIGNKAYFEVRTKCGLAPGIYKARISVGSNMCDELGGFDVSFEVTEKTLYTVTVDSGDAAKYGIGYGYLINENNKNGIVIKSNTYYAGEKVSVRAVILDRAYEFTGWTSGPPVGFKNASAISTSFSMPESNVTVYPNFEPTWLLWIRPINLEDYNPGATSPNPLRENVPPYTMIAFDETIEEYRVILEDAVDQNYIKFYLKESGIIDGVYRESRTPEIIEDIEVTITTKFGSCGYTRNEFEYTTDLFQLEEGLNPVTIKLEYTDKDDPNRTVYTQEYTIYILLNDQVNVKLAYGNSPFGLIESAKNLDDTQKEQAKQYFKEKHGYSEELVPEGASNTYAQKYSVDAWAGINCDEDSHALFVYNGEKFVDPGYDELKNSDGDPVDESSVTRYITVNVMPDNNDIINSLPLADNDENKIELTFSGEKQCEIDIMGDPRMPQGYRIRPGIYRIDYKFTDSDNSTKTFRRYLIILAEKGDVNVNGKVETAKDANNARADAVDANTDYNVIYRRMTNKYYDDILRSNVDWKRLYAYRVCDVTADRNVNSVDANAIRNTEIASEYYERLPSSFDDVGKQTPYDPEHAVWPKDDWEQPSPRPVLTLDYLGTGDAPADVADMSTPRNDKSTIWLGVGIRNPQYLEYFMKDGVYSMDFAIDYDRDILEPVENFASEISLQNMRSTASETSLTHWANAYVYAGATTKTINLGDYTSKTAGGNDYESAFVTILSKDGTKLRLKGIDAEYPDDPEGTPEDGADNNPPTAYMLRIPFTLNKIPGDDYVGVPVTVHLSENTLVMGGGETGAIPSASWEGVQERTTLVNNLYNHFDGTDFRDLFNTNGMFKVSGTVRGWNPQHPFQIDAYGVTADGTITESPVATYLSDTKDATGKPLMSAHDALGNPIDCDEIEILSGFNDVEWHFTVSLYAQFDEYRISISKRSHLTYPSIPLTVPEGNEDCVLQNPNAPEDNPDAPIELVVGDINSDELVQILDHYEMMRFFNRRIPWLLNLERFRSADLNGDNKVNVFDEELLQRNYNRWYTPTDESAGDNEEGGGTP